MKNKVKRVRIKKKPQVLKGIANTLIYGTPLATLVGMGIKVYVNDAPKLSFLDNFTFQFSFWAVVAGIIIVPTYLSLLRKKIKERMLLQEAHDGYVAPRFRLIQTAQYGVSMGLLVALVYVLRLLSSDEMLMFLGISGIGGMAGYVALTIDSVNKQTNKELNELQNK